MPLTQNAIFKKGLELQKLNLRHINMGLAQYATCKKVRLYR